ncbi:HAD family hydrolase [Mucilaginibacter myungsuensis]|uniref:HAD family hydrolase n=1 Tax=Mucilaginibacter myungsuensis TaxID=649104 RepID=A0A929L0R2_9SPHI|nr:HAD family hydrolase [Mucilaginibacter myungsuensis]MBE9662384.1 HAD family hydrolase [Mucilaginibacter myungsuensis]MDN3599179.1 HAD family hydrolase [Mucilaginibacter myungsuensis]
MDVKTLTDIDLTHTDLVLLDLDNTLYHYHSCHSVALNMLCRQFADEQGVGYEQAIDLYNASRRTVHHTNLGTAASHSRFFYVQYMVESVLGRTDTELILKYYNSYWSTFIAEMELLDGALLFLQGCREKNIPVVLVTDMTAEVQFLKIRHLGIGEYLTYMVTSEEAGVEKPHPFIFELAISKVLKANMQIVNIAVIGDDTKKDNHISSVYNITNYHLTGHA